jgi:hypothetical protein
MPVIQGDRRPLRAVPPTLDKPEWSGWCLTVALSLMKISVVSCQVTRKKKEKK